MTTYEPSTEDVETVAAAIYRSTLRTPDVARLPLALIAAYGKPARAALMSLVGRLLPTGGETHTEWGVNLPGNLHVCLDPAACQRFTEATHKRRRTVTTYPPGPIAEVTGRWEEVG